MDPGHRPPRVLRRDLRVNLADSKESLQDYVGIGGAFKLVIWRLRLE